MNATASFGVLRRTDVIGVLPLEPDLEVVVLVKKLKEPVEELLTLLLGDTINVTDVASHRENTLPTGDWVGPHNGMDGLEDGSDVLRCTTRLIVKLEAVTLSGLCKAGLLESHLKCLDELLERFAEDVIQIVSASPKGI